MRMLRLLVVPAFLLLMAGTALADDIQVIFDPQPPQVGNFNIIQQQGVDYSVNFGSCSQAGVPAAMAGDAGCMLFINESGLPINQLTVTFTVNSALAGQTVNCISLDAALSANDCAAAGILNLNDTVTVDFFGGTPIPNFMAFFIAENGVDAGMLPTFGVTVPAYDPSTLTLLAAGMAFLAMGGLRRMA